MIELDRTPPTTQRPGGLWTGALIGLALLVAGAVGGLVATRADAHPSPTRHVVEFVIEGEWATVDHVSVDGQPAETGRPFDAVSLAVVTVRSPDTGAAACSIIVDDRHAVSARGAYGQAATCVWAVR